MPKCYGIFGRKAAVLMWKNGVILGYGEVSLAALCGVCEKMRRRGIFGAEKLINVVFFAKYSKKSEKKVEKVDFFWELVYNCNWWRAGVVSGAPIQGKQLKEVIAVQKHYTKEGLAPSSGAAVMGDRRRGETSGVNDRRQWNRFYWAECREDSQRIVEADHRDLTAPENPLHLRRRKNGWGRRAIDRDTCGADISLALKERAAIDAVRREFGISVWAEPGETPEDGWRCGVNIAEWVKTSAGRINTTTDSAWLFLGSFDDAVWRGGKETAEWHADNIARCILRLRAVAGGVQ